MVSSGQGSDRDGRVRSPYHYQTIRRSDTRHNVRVMTVIDALRDAAQELEDNQQVNDVVEYLINAVVQQLPEEMPREEVPEAIEQIGQQIEKELDPEVGNTVIDLVNRVVLDFERKQVSDFDMQIGMRGFDFLDDIENQPMPDDQIVARQPWQVAEYRPYRGGPHATSSSRRPRRPIALPYPRDQYGPIELPYGQWPSGPSDNGPIDHPLVDQVNYNRDVMLEDQRLYPGPAPDQLIEREKSGTSDGSNDISDRECIICFGGGNLISSCKCGVGNNTWHYECLVDWIISNLDRPCKWCHSPYEDPLDRIKRVYNPPDTQNQVDGAQNNFDWRLFFVLIWILISMGMFFIKSRYWRGIAILSTFCSLIFAIIVMCNFCRNYSVSRQPAEDNQVNEIRFEGYPVSEQYPSGTRVVAFNHVIPAEELPPGLASSIDKMYTGPDKEALKTVDRKAWRKKKRARSRGRRLGQQVAVDLKPTERQTSNIQMDRQLENEPQIQRQTRKQLNQPAPHGKALRDARASGQPFRDFSVRQNLGLQQNQSLDIEEEQGIRDLLDEMISKVEGNQGNYEDEVAMAGVQGSAAVVPSTSASLRSHEKPDQCVICRSTEGPFIQPCECHRDYGLYHYECLGEWMAKSCDNPCKICKVRYQDPRIRRVHRELTFFEFVAADLFSEGNEESTAILAMFVVLVLLLSATKSVPISFIVIILITGLSIFFSHLNSRYQEFAELPGGEVQLTEWPGEGYPNNVRIIDMELARTQYIRDQDAPLPRGQDL